MRIVLYLLKTKTVQRIALVLLPLVCDAHTTTMVRDLLWSLRDPDPDDEEPAPPAALRARLAEGAAVSPRRARPAPRPTDLRCASQHRCAVLFRTLRRHGWWMTFRKKRRHHRLNLLNAIA